jgi:hypothetical protein
LFTGFCGVDRDNAYHAAVEEDSQRVVVSVFGPRPFSNLCAGPQELVLHLASPLGGRALIDGYDGKSHPMQRT